MYVIDVKNVNPKNKKS